MAPKKDTKPRTASSASKGKLEASKSTGRQTNGNATTAAAKKATEVKGKANKSMSKSKSKDDAGNQKHLLKETTTKETIKPNSKSLF